MKVYTAGDMKSGWQDRFAALLPQTVRIIDPRCHGLLDPAQYTAWDLAGVLESDVVVAYMGPHNPSGFGLSLEVGYGFAQGKRIIFVDCLGTDWRTRYFDMVRQVSEVVFSLEEAAAKLRA